MPREKTSVSREDYLKAIWEFVQEEKEPISARLAEELGVTPPAVTAALKRLARDGLLRVGRNGHIALTSKGNRVADRLAMRHQLAEKLLTEVIGLDWTRAHDEAERLEHGISPEVEKLLLARFGADGFCPHGVPLRGGLAKLRRTHGAIPLADVAAGRVVEVLCVYEKDPKFLEFLAGLSLHPGARARIRRCEYDETMTLTVGNRTVHMGKPATSRIWVRPLSQ
jgi:DtxR family transcriptional regulator, Mn-dependent transcriptional regulator